MSWLGVGCGSVMTNLRQSRFASDLLLPLLRGGGIVNVHGAAVNRYAVG